MREIYFVATLCFLPYECVAVHFVFPGEDAERVVGFDAATGIEWERNCFCEKQDAHAQPTRSMPPRYTSARSGQWMGAQIANHTRRAANRETVGRHRGCHHSSRANGRAASDGDAIEHQGSRANPAVVFDHDPFGGDALIHDRSIGIREDVIDGEHLHARAEEHVVADADSALAPHDRAFANERPAT